MPNGMTITKDQAIRQVLAQLEGPIALNKFVERVLAIWPSHAKNPATGIRRTLRWEHAGRTLIFLTSELVAPIHIAMQDVSFRVNLSRQEVNRGVLLVYPAFTCFLPQQVQPREIEFLDARGRSIPTCMVKLKYTQQTILGPGTYQEPAFNLGAWYEANQIKRDDSLLVTIMDWKARQFRLAHEPARERGQHTAEIERQNQNLANTLFELLENARYEYIWGNEAVLTAYARLSDPAGYPGDHWLEVIDQDKRMRWSGTDIRYADSFTPLETILLEPEKRPRQKNLLSKSQAQEVYRFKAALWHRKGLWRRIEIQGGQTLGQFDSALRDAFRHDQTDHLSGFWKLVRRGQSRRFREVDLGDVNPFGGGEGAELKIGALGLKPGDQLKYVYDFGDWIEHRLTLEAIAAPEEDASYPRVVDRNKPRYRYCRRCKSQGQKTVATWICIECSNEEQRQVLVCKDCLGIFHEAHYADEILY
jgi:hypothetical protein